MTDDLKDTLKLSIVNVIANEQCAFKIQRVESKSDTCCSLVAKFDANLARGQAQ